MSKFATGLISLLLSPWQPGQVSHFESAGTGHMTSIDEMRSAWWVANIQLEPSCRTDPWWWFKLVLIKGQKWNWPILKGFNSSAKAEVGSAWALFVQKEYICNWNHSKMLESELELPLELSDLLQDSLKVSIKNLNAAVSSDLLGTSNADECVTRSEALQTAAYPLKYYNYSCNYGRNCISITDLISLGW